MFRLSEDFYAGSDKKKIEEVLYEEIRKTFHDFIDEKDKDLSCYNKGKIKAYLFVLSIISNPEKEENIWDKILPKKFLMTLKKI
jgi:ureidoglycolate hydrolase